MSQIPSANQRFELALNLREEHYPFWSQGRLNSVKRVDLLVWSTQAPVPGSIDIFKNPDKNDTTTKGALIKDTELGNLLRGPLTNGLPAKPDGELKLFFTGKAMSDLWIAVTWGGE